MKPVIVAAALALIVAGCVDPKDRRPGLKLGGETAGFPADWAFTDAHKEIAVEVATPYFLPHSVTIWCASVDGRLYIAARAPETKHWPGWVDDNPNVRLGIGEQVYAVRLEPVDDPDALAHVEHAYARKYELSGAGLAEGPPVRYWQVVPPEV